MLSSARLFVASDQPVRFTFNLATLIRVSVH
jgi:hypothetical protein